MASAAAKSASPTQQLARARAAQAMKRVSDEASKRKHTIAIAVLSAGIGYYERSGRKLPSFITGVPAKLQLAVLAAVVADNTTGETQRYAQATCDGMSAIVGYQFGAGQELGAELGAMGELGAGDDSVDV